MAEFSLINKKITNMIANRISNRGNSYACKLLRAVPADARPICREQCRCRRTGRGAASGRSATAAGTALGGVVGITGYGVSVGIDRSVSHFMPRFLRFITF
jgi:hypothetical protein